MFELWIYILVPSHLLNFYNHVWYKMNIYINIYKIHYLTGICINKCKWSPGLCSTLVPCLFPVISLYYHHSLKLFIIIFTSTIFENVSGLKKQGLNESNGHCFNLWMSHFSKFFPKECFLAGPSHFLPKEQLASGK